MHFSQPSNSDERAERERRLRVGLPLPDRRPYAPQGFVPRLELLEKFSDSCFERDLSFFVDRAALLGALRHRSLVPWEDEVDIGLIVREYDRVASGEVDGRLFVERSAFKEPTAALRIAPGSCLDLEGPALVASAYAQSGQCRASAELQESRPLNRWRESRDGTTADWDFHSADLYCTVGMPTWCGLLEAPIGWRRRLESSFDTLEIRHGTRERFRRDFPFDPGVPAVALVDEARLVETALAERDRNPRPVLVRACREFRCGDDGVAAALVAEADAAGWGLGFSAEGAREAYRRLCEINIAQRFDEASVTTIGRDMLPDSLQPHLDPRDRRAFRYLLSERGDDGRFERQAHGTWNWSWLAEGERFWWFVEPGDAELDWLRGNTMTGILTQDRFRLWGRIRVVHQRAGDLLMFPADWAHRSRTYRRVLGVGGTLLAPAG